MYGVRACVRACVHAYVCVGMCACMCVCVIRSRGTEDKRQDIGKRKEQIVMEGDMQILPSESRWQPGGSWQTSCDI